MKLLTIFIILNAVNVILQTAKSIITIKAGKLAAALANGVAYGLYTIVIVYTVCDLPLWAKVVIVGGCNFIGVYVVKLIEEKMRKDKIWKIEVTIVDTNTKEKILNDFIVQGIAHYNIVDIQKGNYVLNCYSYTQAASLQIKNILANYPNVKYFVTESKSL